MVRRPLLFAFCSLLTVALAVIYANAQVTNITGDQAPPVEGVGHDYIHALNETVNPVTGALSIRINIPVPPGRHLTVPFAFAYDSNAAHHFLGTPQATQAVNAADNPGYLSGGGWSYLLPALNMLQKDNYWFTQSPRQQYNCYYDTDYMLTDLAGDMHPLSISAIQPLTQANCAGIGSTPITGVSPSGIYLASTRGRFHATTTNIGVSLIRRQLSRRLTSTGPFTRFPAQTHITSPLPARGPACPAILKIEMEIELPSWISATARLPLMTPWAARPLLHLVSASRATRSQ